MEGTRIGQESASSRWRYPKFTSAVIVAVVLSAFVAVVSKEIPTASAEIFGPNIRVDDAGADSSSQYSPSIAISKDGRMFVAWTDTRTDIYGDIYATTSLDAGRSFLGSIKINDDPGPAEQGLMDVATDSAGDVHAVWMDWRNDADGTTVPGGGIDGMDNVTVYYSNSKDGGRTWSPNLMLSNNSTGYYDWVPHMAVDVIDNIHVVWESSRGLVGPHYILYSRSIDHGKSFSNPRRIDNSTGSSRYPSIAVDENDGIYVVWEDNRNGAPRWDVWFAMSRDGGLTFGSYKRANNDESPIRRSLPQISARKGLIGVVWYEEPFFHNISFAASFDGGQTFTNSTIVNDDSSPVPRDCPSLWINESHYITVAWDTKRNGNEDIYFANSTDKGQTFSANQRVNDDAGTEYQRIADIAMDSNGYVYLVWMDSRERGDFDIYFTRAPPEIADLELIGISSNPPSPVTEWTTVNLNATIRNSGDREATNVLVRFFDGDPSLNGQIGLDKILPRIDANGGIGYADTQWIATPGGSHTIYVVVDQENNVTESNETNNVATADIYVISLQPPNVTEAILSGNDLENVTINWSLSPDDGMGSMTVTGYRIYKNMTYDTDGLGYSSISSLPNGTSTFTNIGAGEGDLNNYFYRVCARDVNNTTACSRIQAGKFTRPLVKGPNLASIPLIQSDESVEEVLQTVEFDKAWVYDSSSEKWKWHMTFKPYKGALQTINETQGFWVNVTNNCNFTVAGIVPIQTTIHLSKGWNLVAYPSFQQDCTVADLKADVFGERIEGFEASAPPYFLRLMLDGGVLQPGYGYWVRVVDEITWVVTSS